MKKDKTGPSYYTDGLIKTPKGIKSNFNNNNIKNLFNLGSQKEMIVDQGDPLLLDIRERLYTPEEHKSNEKIKETKLKFYDDGCYLDSNNLDYDFRTSRLTNGTEFRDTHLSQNTNNAFTFHPIQKHDSFIGEKKNTNSNFNINCNDKVANSASNGSSTDVCNNENNYNQNLNVEYVKQASLRDKMFEEFDKRNEVKKNDIDAERFIRSGTTTRLSRISHKKSLKIKELAEMMENKMYNSNEDIDNYEEDDYLNIVLEKPIINLKNRKRAKTNFVF